MSIEEVHSWLWTVEMSFLIVIVGLKRMEDYSNREVYDMSRLWECIVELMSR